MGKHRCNMKWRSIRERASRCKASLWDICRTEYKTKSSSGVIILKENLKFACSLRREPSLVYNTEDEDDDQDEDDAGDGYRSLLQGTCDAVTASWYNTGYELTRCALQDEEGKLVSEDSATILTAQKIISAMDTLLTADYVDAIGGIFMLIVAKHDKRLRPTRWLFDCKNGTGSARRCNDWEAKPMDVVCDASILVTEKVLGQWLNGDLDPLTAVLTKQMRVTGSNTALAMRLSMLQPLIQECRLREAEPVEPALKTPRASIDFGADVPLTKTGLEFVDTSSMIPKSIFLDD